jgi:hypothetical protein
MLLESGASIELVNLDGDGPSGLVLWHHLRRLEIRDTQPPYLIVFNEHGREKNSLNGSLKPMDNIYGPDNELHGLSPQLHALVDTQHVDHAETMDTYRNSFETLKDAFDRQLQEQHAQERAHIEQHNQRLEQFLNKKMIIFTLYNGLIKYSKSPNYKVELLVGRSQFLQALAALAKEKKKPLPTIVIVTNAGGVGLRASMEYAAKPWGIFEDAEKSKSKSRRHLPKETEERNKINMVKKYVEKATEMDDYSRKTTARVQMYSSFRLTSAARSSYTGLDKTMRGDSKYLRSNKPEQWHPPDEFMTKGSNESKRLLQSDRNAEREWSKDWRLPRTGMIDAAIEDENNYRTEEGAFESCRVEIDDILWVGNYPTEDALCAKELGIEFHYAKQFFKDWEKQAGVGLGTLTVRETDTIMVDNSDDEYEYYEDMLAERIESMELNEGCKSSSSSSDSQKRTLDGTTNEMPQKKMKKEEPTSVWDDLL